MPEKATADESARDMEYSWLRTREYEGTLGDGPEIGVWPVNYHRVRKYLGFMEEPIASGAWPYGITPSDFDQDPRLKSLPFYRRLYSFDECVRAVQNEEHAKAAFYVTKRWRDAFEGRLDFEQREEDVIGGHAMDVLPSHAPLPKPLDWHQDDFLISPNTWGMEWGNHGFAAITRKFFKDNMYEAWAVPLDFEPPQIRGRGLISLFSRVFATRFQQWFVFQFIDLDRQRPIAWTFYSRLNMQIYVDELFVVPEYRGKGFGTRLLENIHSQPAGFAPTFFIPFADVENGSEYLQDWFKKRGVFFHDSPYKFAAYAATVQENKSGLKPIKIPPKPAFVFVSELEPTCAPTQSTSIVQSPRMVSDEFRSAAERVLATHEELLGRLAR